MISEPRESGGAARTCSLAHSSPAAQINCGPMTMLLDEIGGCLASGNIPIRTVDPL
jgi:hypothetical protein